MVLETGKPKSMVPEGFALKASIDEALEEGHQPDSQDRLCHS